MFGTGTLQYPLAGSYSDGSWLVLPETLATFFLSVLGETSACAGRAGLGCEHSHAPKESLKIRTWWPQCHPKALKHLHRDFTTGQEKLCLPWSPQSSGLCCQPAAIPGWAAGAAPQGAGLQLGTSGISTPATNESNWMFEAFLTWHQGAPSGIICLLGKQRTWPHAALSHRTVMPPLTLARPWHT